MPSDEARCCKATDYAHAMGAGTSTDSGYEGNCWWRLRSPGRYANYAADVYVNGLVRDHGYNVYCVHAAVRPALNPDLSSSYPTSAGTVLSNGDVDETEARSTGLS